MSTKTKQLESIPELRVRLKEYLEQQGYEISEDAKLLGKSGIEHTFDLMAQSNDSFTGYNVAIQIAAGGNRETEASTIFNFANKAYDVGIQNRVLVAIPAFSQEAKHLAQKQRIKVFDGDDLEALSKWTPVQPSKPSKPFRFETKTQLMESLVNLGYRIEERARVRGKSGIEYTFDLLAFSDIDKAGHSLGIDFLSADKEVDLEQVSLFDTKAYDVGLDYKAIVVSPGLSHEARQFAQHQRIKVLELTYELPSDMADEQEATSKEKRPAEADIKPSPQAKSQTKPLKQMSQPEALALIPEVMARRYNAIPLTISRNTLQVAIADPTDIFALEAFSAQSRMRIKPIAANSKEIREAIDFNYKGYGEIEKQISNIAIPTEMTDEGVAINAVLDTPLTQALNMIIDEAIKARSSDIHIEPEENRLRIRYRIDGILQDMISLPLNIHRSLISRIKILSNLNIADHQRPQDGQFSSQTKGREIDVRVAIAPTVWGEMAVLRLLDKSMAILGLVELGLLPDSLARFEEILKVPYGMILISGPTGAGKTTTLYAALNSLDSMGRNIITLEDPAEYRFSDINQIQVNPQAGITFASGLRSILRLDPDVILVGEIRDSETANIAVQAALTGHLMMSSIHAGDTVGVISRLIDLKVEPFLIASSIIGLVAQRMVRRICPDCSQPMEAPAMEQRAYEQETGEKMSKFLYGTGCPSCAHTGYRGRTGIYEILAMSDSVRSMLVNESSRNDIREQATREGLVTMMHDGMRKVKEGITTPSEVLRSAYSLGQRV